MSEQIFEYIWKTKTSSNEYANIFERLKSAQTNIQINLRPKFEQIFEYILAQIKNVENMHLKDEILEKKLEQNRKIYLQIYFDHKANIWISIM